MAGQNVLYEAREGVVLLTVNRPEKLNALDRATIEEIDGAVLRAQRTEGARAIVITGAGSKAFVAGADIGELSRQTPIEGKEYSLMGQQVLGRIESSSIPVIAAINGFALGGGCELALACHVRVAAENAQIGLPEVSLGIFPGFGGTQRLSRLVGKGKALELILSGERIDAREAWRIGLVNRVAPEGGAVKAAEDLARIVASRGPVAVRLAIEAINEGLEMPLEEGLFLEATLFGLVTTTEDFKEGTRAFLEKRRAEFKGR